MQLKEITSHSSEEDILAFCQEHANGNPGVGTGHEMKLSYGLNLLLVKQQKSLLDEQREYNSKQLFWSRILAIATFVLALATVLLVKFH